MDYLTGYYISEKDLLTYISIENLENITTIIDETDEVRKTNVRVSIINTCSYANTLLSNKYKMPFASDSTYITDAFKRALAHIVLYDLLSNYYSVSDQDLEIRKSNFVNSDKFLKDVRDGKQDLVTELDSTTGDKTDRYYFESDRRMDSSFH